MAKPRRKEALSAVRLELWFAGVAFWVDVLVRVAASRMTRTTRKTARCYLQLAIDRARSSWRKACHKDGLPILHQHPDCDRRVLGIPGRRAAKSYADWRKQKASFLLVRVMIASRRSSAPMMQKVPENIFAAPVRHVRPFVPVRLVCRRI